MNEWTMESVLVALGEDAQVVPGGVIKHHLCADGQQRNVLIATYDNGAFAMTPEGRGVLAEWADEPVSATPVASVSAPAPRKRRTKAEMEAARVAAEQPEVTTDTVGVQQELGLEDDLDADLDLDLDFPSDAE